MYACDKCYSRWDEKPTKDEYSSCAHDHCWRDCLCEGCTFECGVCQETFCPDHIVCEPMEDDPGYATYTCLVCYKARMDDLKKPAIRTVPMEERKVA